MATGIKREVPMSVVEEGPKMPPDHYAGPMRVKHWVIYAIFGSEDFGVPLLRQRFYGAGNPSVA